MGEGAGWFGREQEGLGGGRRVREGAGEFGRAMRYGEGWEGVKTLKSMFYNMFQAKKAFAACVYEKKAVTL